MERESEAQRVAALTPDEKMDEDARLHTLEAAVEKQKAEYVWIIYMRSHVPKFTVRTRVPVFTVCTRVYCVYPCRVYRVVIQLLPAIAHMSRLLGPPPFPPDASPTLDATPDAFTPSHPPPTPPPHPSSQS